MADNTILSAPSGTGDTIRDKDRVTAKTQIVGLDLNIGGGSESLMTGTMPTDPTSVAVADGGTLPSKGVQVGGTDGTVFQVLSTDAAGRLNTNVNGTVPVSGPLTDAQLRAATVPVSGTVTASGPLTDAQLRATAVPISGTVTATGPLTDVQLRATAVPVSGTVTASGPLTDAQLRATAVPVSGTVTASGPLTDAQLRATAVPTSLATLPALVAGSALVGFVTVTPSATGGWSKVKYAAQTTTVVKPKGTAGTFGGYYAYNPNATVAYIQVFDLATATTVTLGTTVPDMIYGIPPTSAANLEVTNGVNMALGMQLACTTTALGSTAPGTGLDLTIYFK